MKHLLILLSLLFTVIGTSARNTTKIDHGWMFSHDLQQWRPVTLPHDWSIEGSFDIKAPANNDGGYLPTGTGYYKRMVNIDSIYPEKLYKLYFEGVYMHSDVYVNGKRVGGHPYGYSSFFCDITDALTPGDNLVEVKVDNSRQRNSRWYTGSGIYRHVWLVETDKTHIDPWSVHVTTPNVSAERARVEVDCSIVNHDMPVRLFAEVKDAEGNTVASHATDVASDESFALNIERPILWDIDNPYLYTLSMTLRDGSGKVIDQIETPFGIRSVEFSVDGFKLNGRPLLLNGACLHHDNGILGAASYDVAEWRKARLAKEAGFNAVRCSHNVPAPAFLDACDRLGLLVIDEAFDGWREAKTEHDYAELIDSCWRSDISAMVLRDRNHPSIIAWSIGNEIIERKSPQAVNTAADLAGLCHELDSTRPVTSALAAWDDDWEIYDPLAAQLDIVGYNYLIHKAEGDHQRVPGRIMWQTESYPRDAYANWVAASTHPYILGDFVWTGIDYLGESGIGRHYYEGEVPGEHWERKLWPWHGALCGDIDITGLRKPISYYRDFLYNRQPTIYMAVREPQGYRGNVRETLWGNYPTYESWTWPGWEGKDIEIEVLSDSPEVSLYLDDQLVGTLPTNADNGWKATFSTPYRPGTLKAVANADGASATLSTAGAPAAVRLSVQADDAYPGPEDVIFVLAELVDADGNIVPDAHTLLTFTVDGPATILATGNADMTDPTGYTLPTRLTHRGRVLVAIRPDAPNTPITLRCTSPHVPATFLSLP